MSLALILGRGRLPHVLAQANPDAARLSLAGFAPDGLETETLRVETLGRHLADLRARGIDRVCLAGAIHRPNIDPTLIDAATAPLLPRIVSRLREGDGALLDEVLAIFEEAGLMPVAAQDVAPELLPPPGPLGRVAPDAGMRADAARGMEVLRAIGPADIGQSCVVAGGLTLGVEALPGTDFLLRSIALARGDDASGRHLPPGGVLVKAPKPGQDRRIDWPAIGPETIRRARAAGLSGIALAPGGVLVLDRQAVVTAADASGLAIWIGE